MRNGLQKIRRLVATSSSGNDEIIRILWNPKSRYRLYKNPPTVPVLRLLHPAHTLPPYCFKIHLNIILPSTPMFLKRSLPCRFSTYNFYSLSSLPYAQHVPPSSSFLFDKYRSCYGGLVQALKLSLCNCLQPPVMSSTLFPT
jgi:hypothetical protein